MNKWITHGDTIRFVPGPGWDWSGWDGRLKLTAPDRGMRADGQPVALEGDVVRLGSQLIGKMYTATGFADVPGTGTQPQVSVNVGTLAPQTSIDGQRIVVDDSEGTFVLTCVPSMRTPPAPPIPDPVPVKQGRWFVDLAGQAAAKSGR